MQNELKPPYIKRLDKRGRLTVWLVDGIYVRTHLDEEFTNFAGHWRFAFIPEDDLWIDQATNTDDQQFYIDNMLVMNRMLAKGASYQKAITAAEAEESRERHRAGDASRLTGRGTKLPNGKDVHLYLWQKTEDGVSVWIVNGRLVRSTFDIEFTEGGHDHVYEFIPTKEVWIDNDVEEVERPYILVHELHERNLMSKGWTYNRAHAASSRLEYRCRHHPDQLHYALVKEGWG
jgi:hypothetical protein